MDSNQAGRPDPNALDGLFFFDRSELVDLGQRRRDEYRRNSPFPHMVMDDFLPQEVADRLAREFPSPAFEGFRKPDNEGQVNKLARLQETYFEGVSPLVRHILNELNGLAFLDFLAALTGIANLIPDPHFHAGAVHAVLPGGRLDIHADFNRDERRQLDRRINVILYLNPLWQEKWGGHLELWDSEMRVCEKRILPIHNRCFVFNTTTTSYHGHPQPLTCPKGLSRNSMAAYYYTNGRDDGDMPSHGTLWQRLPTRTP